MRYQAASELRADLKRLKRDTDSGRSAESVTIAWAGEPPVQKWRRWVAVLAGVIAIAAAILLNLFTRPLPPPKVLRTVQITSDGRDKTGPLVTDGARLYFPEDTGGRGVLAQVSATGGETIPIPAPFQNAFPLDISPTGSELLVGVGSTGGTETEFPLWVLPALGGSPHRFGDVVAHAGAWSPDGQEIVYGKAADLYLAKSDGTESRKLVTVDGSAYQIRWSPDGRVLRLRCSILKVTHSLYGRLNPTEPIFIPYFRVGALLPQNMTVSGLPTESTSFSALRMALLIQPSMSGLFEENPGSSRGQARSQHS